MAHRHHISTLFPYTTLFRSSQLLGAGATVRGSATKTGSLHRQREHVTHRRGHRPALAPNLRTTQEGPSIRVPTGRSEEHTSELQSQSNLVCRLLLVKKKSLG